MGVSPDALARSSRSSTVGKQSLQTCPPPLLDRRLLRTLWDSYATRLRPPKRTSVALSQITSSRFDVSLSAGSATRGYVWGFAGVRLGGVWLRVGGEGVEEAWIGAEGAEDVGGGFVAVEEVHWCGVVRGVLDERIMGPFLPGTRRGRAREGVSRLVGRARRRRVAAERSAGSGCSPAGGRRRESRSRAPARARAPRGKRCQHAAALTRICQSGCRLPWSPARRRAALRPGRLRRRRWPPLGKPDADTDTSVGLSASAFLIRTEGRRRAADLVGSSAERCAGRDLPARDCYLLVAVLLLEQPHAASLLPRTTFTHPTHQSA